MANLNLFRRNSKAIETGEWVPPGEEYGDLEVLVRGFTDDYTNAHQARLRAAARQYSGDARRIPAQTSRAILVDVLVDKVLLDVRNADLGDGQPVTLAQFVDLLRSPDYADLVDAVVKAASQVGILKAEETKEAAGN